MSGMQRNKGKAGEREIAALIAELTGWDVRRRVRQHGGDDDLVGIAGWAPEVKRHKTAGRAEIGAWWRQAVVQATNALPVLFYRPDRCEWRAVWPLAALLTEQHADYWRDYEWTCDSTVAAWAAVAREMSEASP